MKQIALLLVCTILSIAVLPARVTAMPPHIKARFELMTGNWQSQHSGETQRRRR